MYIYRYIKYAHYILFNIRRLFKQVLNVWRIPHNSCINTNLCGHYTTLLTDYKLTLDKIVLTSSMTASYTRCTFAARAWIVLFRVEISEPHTCKKKCTFSIKYNKYWKLYLSWVIVSVVSLGLVPWIYFSKIQEMQMLWAESAFVSTMFKY